MVTTLSRTVMVPVRAAVPSLTATMKVAGPSPARGMLPVTVIHGTSD